MAKFKKLALISSAVLMTTAFAFGVASCKEEETAHVHSYGESWTTDATHHWYGCTGTDCTDAVGKAEHAWNEGEETANGENTVKCVVCGYEKKETVATKLAVGEDTTVKVVAGAATEVAVDAEAGSYTISWTNPKTVVKVGETEYKKADSEDAEGYVGTADLLWIEDGVKVTVGTTDGSAADIVIACAKYSAPQLMSYDHSAMMSMMTGGESPETETVANGERGTQFTIYAQNPGWYYVFAEAEDGEDNVETPDVRENDYSATISVSASNAYTTPVTVTEGVAAIEVPANSVIDVVVTHDASTAIDVMAYALYMIELDPEAIANQDYMNAYKNSLAEVTLYLNPFNNPTQTQELFVPMASRVYGRINGITDPVLVSWNDPSLVFDIAGTVYTQEDCPVKVERDTFNPTGVYFTAYTTNGQFAMDMITFETTPVAYLENTTYNVLVDSGSTYRYVAPVGGVYSFTVDYDAVEEFSVGAQSGGIQTPDTWYKDGSEVTETVTLTAILAKGAEIGVTLVHDETTTQELSFTVSSQPFTATNSLNVPTTKGTPEATEITVATKTPYALSLTQGGYYSLNIAYAADTANAAEYVDVYVYVDGYPMMYNPYDPVPYKFSVTEGVSPEIVVWATMMDGSWANLNGEVFVALELTEVDPPKALTLGTNSWTIDELGYGAETEGAFTATEAGNYTFTLGDGVTAVIQSTADEGMSLYINNMMSPNTTASISLNAGETIALTIVNLNGATPLSFTITKNA